MSFVSEIFQRGFDNHLLRSKLAKSPFDDSSYQSRCLEIGGGGGGGVGCFFFYKTGM
jgi:hypothetical protein